MLESKGGSRMKQKETIKVIRTPAAKKVSFVVYGISIDTLKRIVEYTNRVACDHMEIGIYQNADRTKTTITIKNGNDSLCNDVLSLLFGDVEVSTIDGVIPVRDKIIPNEDDVSEMESVDIGEQDMQIKKEKDRIQKMEKSFWMGYDKQDPIPFLKKYIKLRYKYANNAVVSDLLVGQLVKFTNDIHSRDVTMQRNFFYIARNLPECQAVCIKAIEAKGVSGKKDLSGKEYDNLCITALSCCDQNDLDNLFSILEANINH